MIRVLIVDDSATIRQFLRRVLEEDPNIFVVGEAADGAIALTSCEALRPDVITMDLVMPHSGVEAIRLIMARIPTPIIIVSALANEANHPMVFDGLAAGALTVVMRPGPSSAAEYGAQKADLIRAVKTVADVALVGRTRSSGRPGDRTETERDTMTLVGIGASTGGPVATMEMLHALPEDFAPSMALVQHLTLGFVPSLIEWLRTGCSLPIRLAEAGMKLPWRGMVVAPDGFHLSLKGGVVSLLDAAPRMGQRPSVDTLFESMADWRPRSCAGVLLSGMGRDGAIGLGRLREMGGRTMAQSETSCIVFGMPGAAVEMGAAELVLSPAALARELITLSGA
ncbi:MAG TPA: chemotaxis protein CheB [Candidatus Dormibacteraeota bacterium]|nr:chemotaxis protein CheB [Candidatus Dormibacteraeota bacterium]